jgi:hypothetical protein
MRGFNSHAMKMTILFGGATHITFPLLLDARINIFKELIGINLMSPNSKFKILDSWISMNNIQVDDQLYAQQCI